MSEAVPTIFIDNDQTRVTEWRFAPGAATGWHRHEMNYVVVPLMDGQLRIVGPNGEASIAELSMASLTTETWVSSTMLSITTIMSLRSSRSK